jgi:lipopolysaccharide/colanic/teichoic acid biosynthesis glycosyltransferase
MGTSFPLYPMLKRILDILMALLGLLILTPFWVVIWCLIVIEDGLPVFIKQNRIGKNGKTFTAFKFRSMCKSALCAQINHQAKEDDPRVTRVGRVLRNTAIDESPQLLNILRGDMSFVGPRPLLTTEVELYSSVESDMRKIPGYDQRISVVPGLTGLAQFYAPRDIPRDKKFELDLKYIRERCLLTDIKLIFQSLAVTFLGRWEKRSKKLVLRNSTTRNGEKTRCAEDMSASGRLKTRPPKAD